MGSVKFTVLYECFQEHIKSTVNETRINAPTKYAAQRWIGIQKTTVKLVVPYQRNHSGE